MAEVVVEGVCKEYSTAGEPLVVLQGISLRVTAGESLAIVGPSGSGKSTLLHILATLDRPTSGRVQIDGLDPAILSEPELAEFRNRRIGLVFQDHYLLPQCTVLENVLVPVLGQGPVSGDKEQWAKSLLERVGLSDRLDHRPAELSGGQRQRCAIARALVQKPLLILADEPTGNLDRTSARGVSQLLLELQAEQGSMLVVVTHSLELAGLMQKQYELDAGQLSPLSARTL